MNYDDQDDILTVLKASGGSASRFEYARLDSALLGMVVACVTGKDGQISFGCDRAGTKGIVTIWYKGYPTKTYCETPEEMMARLAWTLDLFAPKTAEYDTWRTYAEQFKQLL